MDIDIRKAKRIVVTHNGTTYYYNADGPQIDDAETAQRITAIDDDSLDSGNNLYIFCVADCAFPVYDLVAGECWEDAYGWYIDFAEKHRGIGVSESQMPDYIERGEFTGQYTSDGKPVDTEAIQGFEVQLLRIEF